METKEMCRNVKIAIGVMLSFVGSLSAGSWVGPAAGDGLWDTASNWSSGVPGPGEDIYIEASWNQGKQPLIQSGIDGVGGTLRMGSTNDTISSLTINGGSLTLSSHFILGQGANSIVAIYMNGGSLTANSLWSGNMQGWGMATQGTLYMTDGVVNLIGEGLYVSRSSGASSLGVQLDGGILNAASVFFGAGGMDITAGKLVLPLSYEARIKDYIGKSWLTGYGSKDNVMITTVDNTIEVTAIPEPITLSLFGIGAFALIHRKRA